MHLGMLHLFRHWYNKTHCWFALSVRCCLQRTDTTAPCSVTCLLTNGGWTLIIFQYRRPRHQGIYQLDPAAPVSGVIKQRPWRQPRQPTCTMGGAASKVPKGSFADLFFDGRPVKDKKEAMEAMMADDFKLAFVGQFAGATTGMVIPKEKVVARPRHVPGGTTCSSRSAVRRGRSGGRHASGIRTSASVASRGSTTPAQARRTTSGSRASSGPRRWTRSTGGRRRQRCSQHGRRRSV